MTCGQMGPVVGRCLFGCCFVGGFGNSQVRTPRRQALRAGSARADLRQVGCDLPAGRHELLERHLRPVVGGCGVFRAGTGLTGGGGRGLIMIPA